MRRLVAVFLLVLAPACLWRSYAEVMRVHLEVLAGFAEKAAANAAAGHRPTSNDVTELTYPLQRARQFAHQYREEAERPSYARFLAALDQYEALVTAIDAARGDEARWEAERARLPERLAAWRTAAAEAHAALDRETGGAPG